MKKTQPRTDEELYVSAAVDLQVARDERDSKKGNKAFDRMMQAARRIRANEDDGGESFFSSLLENEAPHVVISAAFNLIPLNGELARKALLALANGPPGEVRFNAEMTLKEWDAGRLDPDWFMK